MSNSSHSTIEIRRKEERISSKRLVDSGFWNGDFQEFITNPQSDFACIKTNIDTLENTSVECTSCITSVPDTDNSDTLHSSCELLHRGRKSTVWRTIYTTAQSVNKRRGEDDNSSRDTAFTVDINQWLQPLPNFGSIPIVVKRYSSNNTQLKSPEEFIDVGVLIEIRLLKHLTHDNIIKLIDVIVAESETKNDDNVCVCLESMDTDLDYFSRRGIHIDDIYQACLLFYQILRAVKYIHYAGIAHCNLMLSNILVNVATFEVKLCDFKKCRPVTNATIEQDISDIFHALEKLFSDGVKNDQRYKIFRTRQLKSINIILNNSLFEEFGLYDSNLDEPNQMSSYKPFPWNELEACCRKHMPMDTLAHLISLEARRHDHRTPNTLDTTSATTVDRALACEMEHGVQVGDNLSLMRMRFANEELATASPIDIETQCSIPVQVSTITSNLSSNDIFEKMFGSPRSFKTHPIKQVSEEQYTSSPDTTFKPINDSGNSNDKRTPRVPGDEHPSEDEDILCEEVRNINYDRYGKHHYHNYSHCSSGINSEQSYNRTPTQSSMSSAAPGSATLSANRCSSLSPYPQSHGNSTNINKQRSTTTQSNTSSSFLWDIGCSNDNVDTCSIPVFDEPYDVCVDWLAHIKK